MGTPGSVASSKCPCCTPETLKSRLAGASSMSEASSSAALSHTAAPWPIVSFAAPSSGLSLLPLMVTVNTWLALPSTLATVKLSVIDCDERGCWIAACVLLAL